MDCEKLDEVAVDLVYDELDPRSAHEAAQHLVGCSRCTALVERLRAGRRAAAELPLEEPSSLLEGRIFDAAAQVKRDPRWPRRILRAVSTAGSYAMRPQVAMAAVLLLMVGSSILLLRGGRDARRTRVVDEGTPVASVEREPSSGALAEGRGAPAVVGAAPLETKGEPARGAVASVGPVSGDLDQKADKSAFRQLPTGRDESKEKSEDDLAKAPALVPPVSPPDVAATAAAGAPAAPAAPPAPAAATKRAMTMATAAAPTAGAVGGGGARAVDAVAPPATFDDSMTAYKAGRYADAAKGFDAAAAAGTRTPTSLLYSGRSHRANGSCVQALLRFQRVVAGYPTSGEAPLAAMEGGDCARELGDVVTARAMYEKARGYAATKYRADTSLAGLSKASAANASASSTSGSSAPASNAKAKGAAGEKK